MVRKSIPNKSGSSMALT